MTKYYFITSPVAGGGKTFIGSGVARVLSKAGRRVVALKAVETGAGGDMMDREDGALLAQATGQAAPRLAILRFRHRGTPAEAAQAEGTTIQFQELVDTIGLLGREADLVLIEDSGGIGAPIDGKHTMLDLARALGARALLVLPDWSSVTKALVNQFATKRVPIAGVVVNQRDPHHADRGMLDLPNHVPILTVGPGDQGTEPFRTVAKWLA